MPETATVEDIEEVYMQGWKMGLKALAIYRDNCKVGQPMTDATKKKSEDETESEEPAERKAGRIKMPQSRPARTYSYRIGDAKGYLTAGSYPNDGLGEIFLKIAKQGSTLSGAMDAFAIAVSIGLQYGVPLEVFVRKFINQRFDPSGMTSDPDIRFAQSPIDYIFRRLALDYLPFDQRSIYGIYTTEERTQALETGDYQPVESDKDYAQDETEQSSNKIEEAVEEKKAELQTAHSTAELVEKQGDIDNDAPYCMNCGVKMRPAGSCHICELCGSTSGCS
jgi:ribonucleoside-diphosphate reductase alpha chain